jgi:membrane-bound ClpP family serine protease
MRRIGTWFVAVGLMICLLDLLSPNVRSYSILGLALTVAGTGFLVASRSTDGSS